MPQVMYVVQTTVTTAITVTIKLSDILGSGRFSQDTGATLQRNAAVVVQRNKSTDGDSKLIRTLSTARTPKGGRERERER